jgi:molybdopterin molybdotransferase
MALMPIDDALALLLHDLSPLAAEKADLVPSSGRVLAQAVVSPRHFPFEDNSAMDGYALAASEGPWRLVGESAAGHPFEGRVAEGEAVRISTGAVVPQGADSVLIQENAERHGSGLSAMQTPRAGQHIRHAGSDLNCGDALLDAGHILQASDLAALAGLGITHVPLRRQPKVIIFATGDELVAPGEPRQRGQIYESNARYLSAAVSEAGAELLSASTLPDDRSVIDAALKDAIERADLLLLSGGVSVGDHDHVGAALAELCGGLTFYKVRMKPGKPVAAARKSGCVLLGLPGNPASTLVAFEIFGRAVLKRLGGAGRVHRRLDEAVVLTSLPAAGSRGELLRASLTPAGLRPCSRQGSGDLSSLLAVDALIYRPPGSTPITAGDRVPYLALFGPGSDHPLEAQWAVKS